MKKIIIFVLLILLTALSALNTYATEIPDLSRTASVSVEMTYMGSPVGGGTLTAYRVAEIKIENGADYGFAFLEEYADCEADISDFGDVNLASEFASFIKENNISGTTLAIDEKGNVGLMIWNSVSTFLCRTILPKGILRLERLWFPYRRITVTVTFMTLTLPQRSALVLKQLTVIPKLLP